tara:strand:- start:3419 stop:3754 length:336 start_codon:yes stop_codon:yes gene_type:complete
MLSHKLNISNILVCITLQWEGFNQPTLKITDFFNCYELDARINDPRDLEEASVDRFSESFEYIMAKFEVLLKDGEYIEYTKYLSEEIFNAKMPVIINLTNDDRSELSIEFN